MSLRRLVTDAIVSNGSSVLTSKEAEFTVDDEGAELVGEVLAPGTRVWLVSSGSVVLVEPTPTVTGIGLHVLIKPMDDGLSDEFGYEEKGGWTTSDEEDLFVINIGEPKSPAPLPEGGESDAPNR